MGPLSSQPCLFLRVESLLLEQAEEINLLVLLLLLLLLFSLLLSLMLSLLLLSFTSRSCLFLRIESALLEQAEDIDLAESVFLHQLIQPSFLRFHRVDTLIIGIRFMWRGIRMNGKIWNSIEKNGKAYPA